MYVRLERLTADEVEMATAKKQLKDDRLYLRVSSKEREVISEAAEAAHKDLSAFVLDAALVSAERPANRRLFALDKASWQEFNAIWTVGRAALIETAIREAPLRAERLER
jgi:uncharacterized protein (DUF1778 family)